MLGILLIFFVGKYFYDLAARFNKSKWLFAIIGVVSYYAGTFLIGLAIAFFGEVDSLGTIESIPAIGLTLIAIPAGILTSWLTYSLLKKSWSTAPVDTSQEDVLDSDFLK
jgi:hypothetical protein